MRERAEKLIEAAILGPDTPAAGEVGTTEQRDIASTIIKLLRIDPART
jgi:hypothetical protein